MAIYTQAMLEGQEKLPNSEKYLFRELKSLPGQLNPEKQYETANQQINYIKNYDHSPFTIMEAGSYSEFISEYFNLRKEGLKWIVITQTKIDQLPPWVISVDSSNSPDYFLVGEYVVIAAY